MIDINNYKLSSSSIKIPKVTLKGVTSWGQIYGDIEEQTDLIERIPTKTSELTNDSGFLTEHQTLKTINNQSIVGEGNITIEGTDVTKTWVDEEIGVKLTGYAKKTDLPTKTSQLTNDSGFLTEHQSLAGYATESWVEGKKYLTAVPDTYALKSDVPTKTSQLTNDSKYITLNDYYKALTDSNLQKYTTAALKSDLPTKLSELTNDALYMQTKDLNDDLLTKHTSAALKSDLPTKTSQLTNDSGFLTEHQSLAGYATESWVTEQINAAVGDAEDITNEILS